MKYQRIRGHKHYVFKDEEEYSSYFNDDCKKPIYWKDGEEGDWALSDDGGIVQLLKVSDITHPHDRKNYKYSKGWCRTIVGTFLINAKTKMDTDFKEHKNRYTFSKKIGKKKNITKRKNPTNKEKIFAVNVVTGMGPVKSYMDAFNEIDDSKAKKKALVLLKQERIMKEIEKSVMDIAKEQGIDHRYILSKLKNLADYSEDDNIMLQSTKELGKIIGTSGSTIKQRELGIVGMFQGFTPDQLGKAERREINGTIEDKGEVNEIGGAEIGDGERLPEPDRGDTSVRATN